MKHEALIEKVAKATLIVPKTAQVSFDYYYGVRDACGTRVSKAAISKWFGHEHARIERDLKEALSVCSSYSGLSEEEFEYYLLTYQQEVRMALKEILRPHYNDPYKVSQHSLAY